MSHAFMLGTERLTHCSVGCLLLSASRKGHQSEGNHTIRPAQSCTEDLISFTLAPFQEGDTSKHHIDP